MLFLFAMCGAATAWLWFFPPDSLSERARRALALLGVAATVGSGWGTHAMLRANEAARRQAVEAYRRAEREKEEAIERLREGYAQPEPTLSTDPHGLTGRR